MRTNNKMTTSQCPKSNCTSAYQPKADCTLVAFNFVNGTIILLDIQALNLEIVFKFLFPLFLQNLISTKPCRLKYTTSKTALR